jgi:hypothetical protein
MTDIRMANAPCSWGALEFEGLEGEEIAYGQMLDELREDLRKKNRACFGRLMIGSLAIEAGGWGTRLC